MVPQIVQGVRKAFYTGRTLSYEYRKQQLLNIVRMLEECEADIVEALRLDLRRVGRARAVVALRITAGVSLNRLAARRTSTRPSLWRWTRPRTRPCTSWRTSRSG